MNPTTDAKQPIRIIKAGIVDSDKRHQTRRVIVAFKSKHPKYGKYVSRRTILHIHDPNNESRKGDRVEIEPCPPVSKTKRWRLVRIVEKAAVLETEHATG